jgi:hypothetical protein
MRIRTGITGMHTCISHKCKYKNDCLKYSSRGYDSRDNLICEHEPQTLSECEFTSLK